MAAAVARPISVVPPDPPFLRLDTPPLDFHRTPSSEAALLAAMAEGEGDTKTGTETKFKPWTPIDLPPSLAMRAMWKGLHEAITDHLADPKHGPIYCTPHQVIPPEVLEHISDANRGEKVELGRKRKVCDDGDDDNPKPTKVGKSEAEAAAAAMPIPRRPLTWGVWASRGKRVEMEDENIVFDTSDELVAAAMDGHGGVDVVELTRKEIKARFFSILESCNNNIHTAFQRVVYHIHGEALKRPTCKFMGATVVMVYIDKRIRMVYTAAVGDSSAAIHRLIEGVPKIVPLCPIRNWGCPKEVARAKDIFNDPQLAKGLPKPKFEEWSKLGSKFIRIQGKTILPGSLPGTFNRVNLNLSRGLGDEDFRPLVSSEPVISVCNLLDGDIVELVTDGASDYWDASRRSESVHSRRDCEPEVIAKAIHDSAVARMHEHDSVKGDNVTVIIIKP